MWPDTGLGHLELLCLNPGLHVQKYCIGGFRSFASVIVGALAPVLDAASASAPDPVPAPAPAPSPCLQVVLLRPHQLPRLARFDWRAMKIFLFTVARSVMSLMTVAVSCVMAARSLAVAIARFAMASTVSCWR